jgi:opacity protein-like surface antigen
MNFFRFGASDKTWREPAGFDSTHPWNELILTIMKTGYRSSIVLLLTLSLGITAARGQYYEPVGQTTYYNPKGAGPYIRLDSGGTFFRDGQLTQFGGPANNPVHYNVGFDFDTAIGYAFNKYVGADFEFGIIGARINSVPGFITSGSYLDNVPFLGNLTLSYPIPRTLIVPYIGGGAGGSASSFNTDGFGINGGNAVFGYESSVEFAWQAFAGVRIKLNSKMSLGIGYKYFATENPSFTYPPAFIGNPNLTVGFTGVRTHSILLTFQASFW